MASLVQISRGCEYALGALQWIASMPSDEPLQAEQVAEAVGIPKRFAANILTELTKSALLRAQRGAVRGYALARPAAEISLLDIIEAYEGPFEKPWCFMNRERPCAEGDPCALHYTWLAMRDSIRAVLASVTLENISTGKPFMIQASAEVMEALAPILNTRSKK